MNAKTKKTLGTVAALVILAAVVIAGILLRPDTQQGSKTVTIEVVNSAGASVKYEVITDAEYLRGAMEAAEGLTFGGAEGEFGMVVDTVNGERADYTLDGAYWSFYSGGAYCSYGIDSQPVADGDAFRIVWEPAA